MRYLGRTSAEPVIGRGEKADLVILNADPLASVRNTLSIEGVILKNVHYDRRGLNALVMTAKEAARRGAR